jgi:hypothetical protein
MQGFVRKDLRCDLNQLMYAGYFIFPIIVNVWKFYDHLQDVSPDILIKFIIRQILFCLYLLHVHLKHWITSCLHVPYIQLIYVPLYTVVVYSVHTA